MAYFTTKTNEAPRLLNLFGFKKVSTRESIRWFTRAWIGGAASSFKKMDQVVKKIMEKWFV